MAYLTVFHSVDPELLNGHYSFAEIMTMARRVGQCSHYLAGDPRFARLLDEGHPIADASHPLVRPHYRLPAELPAIRAEIEMLREEVGDGDWVTDQIAGFLRACRQCVASGTAMVVTLS